MTTSTRIILEFQGLEEELHRSKSVFGWLNANFELEQDILFSLKEGDGLATFFRQQSRCSDIVRSLHKPRDIIPASLHPAD